MQASPLPPRKSPGSGSKINWLIVVFVVQMVLFMTFVGSFFTMEQHRQSELHDMGHELHTLRTQNRHVTKQLLSAEKRNTRLLEARQQPMADQLDDTGRLQDDDEEGEPEEEGEDDVSSKPSQRAPAKHEGTWANATSELRTGLSGRCARLLREGEWWTYEVCVGGLVRQFHQGDQKGAFEEYVLGRFDPSVTLSLSGGVTHFAYNRGAACSPTDATPRSARLTVKCVQGAEVEDLHLITVEEPSTCSYSLTAEAPAHMCTGLPAAAKQRAGGAEKAAGHRKRVVVEDTPAAHAPTGAQVAAQIVARPLGTSSSSIPRGAPVSSEPVDVTSLPVSGSEASESKRAAVVGAIRHAWGGYVKYAWGADELKPISKRSTDWIGLGLTILDSLDVLWMAGLTDEFTKGVEWIRQSLDFRKQRMVSFFETTIRCLGGLVTAYELSGDAVLLEKATDLGERLGKAFATPSGLPYTTISLASGQHAIPGWTGGNLLLAEVGTVQLEFFALAKHSGRQEFHDKAQKVIDVLDQNGGPTDSDGGRMWPIHIRPDSGKLTGTQISWGAMGDSYYEYLLKMWLYTGKKVPQYKRMYLESVRAMRKQLIFTENGYTFLAESNNKKVIKKMDHLVCFVPGMLALGAQNIPEVHDEHMKLAAALTETCHAMYDKQRTGLAPEFVRFSGRGMEVRHLRRAARRLDSTCAPQQPRPRAPAPRVDPATAPPPFPRPQRVRHGLTGGRGSQSAAARDDRVALLHVALHQGPQVPGMGLEDVPGL